MPQNHPESDSPFVWKYLSDEFSCAAACRDGNLYFLPAVEEKHIKRIVQKIKREDVHPESILKPKPFTKIPIDCITEIRLSNSGTVVDVNWLSEAGKEETAGCLLDSWSDGAEIVEIVISQCPQTLEHRVEEVRFMEDFGSNLMIAAGIPVCILPPAFFSEWIGLTTLKWISGIYVVTVISFWIYRIRNPKEIHVWGETM